MTPHYLFADTETTGLPVDYTDPAHPDCPHLVQLATVATDRGGNILDEWTCIVRPEGFVIPEEASRVHGISQERAMVEGIPLWEAMLLFDQRVVDCQALVCHNHQFDRLILKGAYHRLSIVPHPLSRLERICTMRMYQQKFGGKLIKLTKAHRALLNEEFDGAHSALADTHACRRIFFKMILPEPAPIPI